MRQSPLDSVRLCRVVAVGGTYGYRYIRTEMGEGSGDTPADKPILGLLLLIVGHQLQGSLQLPCSPGASFIVRQQQFINALLRTSLPNSQGLFNAAVERGRRGR